MCSAHGEAEMHTYENGKTAAINLEHGWKLVFEEVF
jgi:hypothetical protein